MNPTEDLLEVKEVEGEGRGYFTLQQIRVGQVILRACPFVSCVNDRYELISCRVCIQPITHNSQPCKKCQRSVVCRQCLQSNLSDPHDSECASLTQLTLLEKERPDLADSLLGGTTAYLRLLLRLLANRTDYYSGRRPLGRVEGRPGPANSGLHGELEGCMDGVDDLEDHLDDILNDDEIEARVYNTIKVAKLLVPSSHKASHEIYAEYLGKLYCNSMTIGEAGIRSQLIQRGYWSGVRGGLYTEYGIGLFPLG
ncbi:unnamed protein product, partial [Choristocarpus tenellus]